ncbi:isopeptide-forming domain-containing fimbrial protein [Bifidobacterium sp. 64T4]|uniref:SpaA isopeptide-forming pilin-related protein n=1 Tax=Bifidobacterium pongonis TaxID=2834432 RepID=UPI001C5A1B79|nr:isopeptide-forming domain-containing fimbrial protein [Bifidobacterium pongonis]MBW3094289.1 isopeptide-forming domain-containing fimbrial protein [Bifidobacterium pongonis]
MRRIIIPSHQAPSRQATSRHATSQHGKRLPQPGGRLPQLRASFRSPKLVGILIALLIVPLTGLVMGTPEAQATELMVKKITRLAFQLDHVRQGHGRSFRVYKIGDYMMNNETGKLKYRIRSTPKNRKPLAEAFGKALGDKYNQYGVDNMTQVLADGVLDQSTDRPWENGTSRKLANELDKVADRMTPSFFVMQPASGRSDKQSDKQTFIERRQIQAGLYFIRDISESTPGATRAISMIVGTGTVKNGELVDPLTEATVCLKNTKNVVNTVEAKQKSAAVGDDIDYTMKGAIANPKPDFFDFTVQPGKGLTLKPDSFDAKVGGNDVTFEDYFTADLSALKHGTDGNDSARFTISARPEKLDEIKGKTVEVDYQATVNEDADGRNKVVNRLLKNDDTETEEFQDVVTKLLDISFWKVNALGEGIPGAVFKLTGNGEEQEATAKANGKVTFTGLKAGTYECTETRVGDGGYLDIKATFRIELGEDGAVRLRSNVQGDPFALVNCDKNTVMNVKRLTQLPLSGAFGAALFVLAGIALGAGGLVFARKSQGLRREVKVR